jgi:carbonic anhydrase
MFTQILKKDLPAGLVIFILSIPLNLGLASALGFSPISGLLSGIAGGFIVGLLGSSAVSIAAPAIGLTAVIVSSISYLESFQLFQLSLLLAGLFQLLWGYAKAGFISSYIPTSVIRGLIAGVGIVLVLKQIPHAVGFDVEAIGNLSFFEKTGENTFTHILILADKFLPVPFFNTILSVLILIYWKKIPIVSIRSIPAPVIVISLGLLVNFLFQKWYPALAIEKTHLINIPPIKWSSYFQNYEILLSFSEIFNYKVWIIGLVIAYLASIETLLSIEAIDRLDPKRRRIHRNKELTAQGVANIVLAFFGGIPIATAIVRSSVNIEMENESKFSGLFHSVFLLIGTFFFIPYLNLIPLSSLAAILIVTGYYLIRILDIKEIIKKGISQFIPFLSTVLGIIFTDILIGVTIGMIVSVFFILRNNYRSSFSTNKAEIGVGETLRIELASQNSFLNKGSIQKTLWDIPENSKVIIDASYSEYIDEDILDVLHEFTSIIAPMKIFK